MRDRKIQNEIIEKIFNQCRKQNLKIVTVESCTGGLISSCITSYSGSSEIFDRGYVTYSNDSKESLIGVDASILAEFGAVSIETVKQMACNPVVDPNTVSIAVTGVAGPDKSEKKPVGLVWLATYRYDQLLTQKLNLGSKSRSKVRQETVREALVLLLKNLEDIGEEEQVYSSRFSV